MEELITPLVTQLGMGGIAGFVVGYAVKKVLKITLVVLGVFFVGLLYMAHIGFIEINYEEVTAAFESVVVRLMEGGATLPNLLTTNLPLAGSFIFGFGIGLKLG